MSSRLIFSEVLGLNPNWDTSCLTHIARTSNANAGIIAQILQSPSELSPISHSPVILTFDNMQCAIMQESWSDL
jgi:hypothetical protein